MIPDDDYWDVFAMKLPSSSWNSIFSNQFGVVSVKLIHTAIHSLSCSRRYHHCPSLGKMLNFIAATKIILDVAFFFLDGVVAHGHSGLLLGRYGYNVRLYSTTQ